METDGSKRSAEHWQQKYYDSLGELEDKEKQWSEVEKVLRLLVSRLTLITETDDKNLARQLDKLREAIREEKSSQNLQRLISEISANISKLDQQKASRPAAAKDLSVNPAQVLLALLDEMDTPAALKRQENFLRKQLARAGNASDIAPLLSDMSQFIAYIKDFSVSKQPAESLQQQAIPEQTEQQGSEEDSGGLLSGLFRKKNKQQQQEDEPEQKKHAEPKVVRKEQQSEDISKQNKPVVPGAESEEQQQHVSPGSADDKFDIVAARQVLIELIEFLQFPSEFSASVTLIKERLDNCRQREELVACIEQLAELIAKVREQVEKERNDLEDFLKQLTGRLHDIDSDITASAKLHDASHHESQKVNTNVQNEVTGIENSVSEALDLQLLKTAVQSRIIIIRDHMDKFIEAEQQRHQQASTLISDLQERVSNMEVETEQLKEQVRKKQEEASRDALTGVANRLAYNERIETEIARNKRYQSPLTLMVWDVDKFKSVNDTYGHAAGDKVLKVIARLLSDNIRETDFIARFGGEEFVILMPETDITAAEPVAEKLRATIEDSEFHFRGKRVVITASCGIAEIKHNETEEQLFQRADDALYKAKETGRNRCIAAD